LLVVGKWEGGYEQVEYGDTLEEKTVVGMGREEQVKIVVLHCFYHLTSMRAPAGQSCKLKIQYICVQTLRAPTERIEVSSAVICSCCCRSVVR